MMLISYSLVVISLPIKIQNLSMIAVHHQQSTVYSGLNLLVVLLLEDLFSILLTHSCLAIAIFKLRCLKYLQHCSNNTTLITLSKFSKISTPCMSPFLMLFFFQHGIYLFLPFNQCPAYKNLFTWDICLFIIRLQRYIYKIF